MRLLIPLLISTIFLVGPASADPIQVGNILDSYGFSDGAIGSGASISLNLWNDSTGARLLADNGDQADLTIIYNRTITGPTAPVASASFEFDGGELRASHSFSAPPASNNPGSRITHTIDFTFASHVTVTGLDVDFRSLNTAGITWEFSKLGYIVAGSPANNAEPTIAPYLSHTAANGAPAGTEGWFLVDSQTTVNNVGTSETGAGTNGGQEQLTNTNGNSILDYDDVGLASGTHITGFRWITALEDVRGTDNIGSGLTSTMFHFSPSGTISAVPEPGGFGFVVTLMASMALRRRRS